MTTPTQRTLKYLRDAGWMAAIVEKRIQMPGSPFGKFVDVWGFADVLACHVIEAKIALVQTTSGAGASFRRRKMLGKLTEADFATLDRRRRKSFPKKTEADFVEMDRKERARVAQIPIAVRTWLRSGGKILLISWAKQGARGAAKRWTERVEQIELRNSSHPTGHRPSV
jgi:hypothetical protein